MSKFHLQTCRCSFSNNLIVFNPPTAFPELRLALTTKTATLSFPNPNPACGTKGLSLEQYAEIAQIPLKSLQTLQQIHGKKVVTYPATVPIEKPPQADAVVIQGARKYCGVFVADCLAVLLFSNESRCCAAVHAGWRGALARVGSSSLAALSALGANLKQISAVLTAGIGERYYRVGEEIYYAFQTARYDVDTIFTSYEDGWHLDLRQAVAVDLVEHGMHHSSIYDSKLDSFVQTDMLWSHRRDKSSVYRNLAFCGWRT